MKSTILASVLLAAGLAGAAAAHTLTLDLAATPPIAAFAHKGALEPIPGARIASAVALDGAGRVSEIALTRTEARATLAAPPGAAAILTRYVGLNAGRGPDRTRKVGSRTANPDVAVVGRSEVDALTLLRPGADLSALPPAPLRLAPVGVAAGLRKGDSITLMATFRGQPLAGATIRLQALASETGGLSVVSGSDGRITVIVPESGPNLFVINHEDRTGDDPDAHVIRRQASLGFSAAP